MILTSILVMDSFYNLHQQGGTTFMTPISLLFLINIGIFIYVVIAIIQKRQISSAWLESIKQIGGLSAAWGTWSTIVGLFYAFHALENSPTAVPFNVICGGMKVALLTVLYGLFAFCLSLFAYIILKLLRRAAPVTQ